MSEEKIKQILEIVLEDKASEGLKKLKKSVDDTSDSVSKSKKNFIEAALDTENYETAQKALGVVLAATATSIFVAYNQIGKMISAASESEAAVNLLNGSLRASGQLSEEASRKLQASAESIQKIARFSDETIISVQSLAINMGASASQAQDLAIAAAGMSIALGKDIDTVAVALAKSLNGAGDGLAKLGISTKGLTTAQLQSGEAIRVAKEKYESFLKVDSSTFAGQIAIISNQFGDIYENLGKSILAADGFKEALAIISSGLVSAVEWINKNTIGITNIVNMFTRWGVQFASFIIGIVRGLNLLLKFFTDVTISLAAIFPLALAKWTDSILKFFGVSSKIFSKLMSVTNGAFESNPFKVLEGWMSKTQDKLFQTWVAAEYPPIKTNVKLDTDQPKAKIKELVDSGVSEAKKFSDELKKAFDEGLKDPFGIFFGQTIPEGFKGTKKQLEELQKQMQLGQILGGIKLGASSIQQGAAGAGSLISAGAGAVAEAYLPGSGQAASEVVKLLGSDPETFKGFFKNFAEGAATFIENLIINLPNLLVELYKLPSAIINRFIEDMPMLIDELSKGLVEAAIAFGLEMPLAAATFISSIVENAPAIAQSLIDAVKNLMLGGGIKNSGGGFLKKLGFAQGGQAFVKSVPGGFLKDTFNANLTSGELIVDRSTAQDLKAFLNNQKTSNQESNSPAQDIVIQIDGREIARAVRGQTRMGFAL